jgi:hypothetical protein
MDCANFDNLVLDALYDELDADASTGMDEHAAGCEACASRIARLRKTQELTRSALESPFPAGLEDRILAAAEAAMAAPTAAKSNVISLADRRPPAARDKDDKDDDKDDAPKKSGVVAFLAKPQFAIAASFVLLLGGLAAFINMTAKRESAATSMAPAAGQGAAAASAAPNEQGQDQDGVPSNTIVAASATATPTASQQLALNEDREAHQAPAPMPGNWKGHAGPASKDTKEEAEKKADPDSFAYNRGLAESGNCKQALPKLEALAKTNPQAELVVARCLAQTQNCAAAVPRFDSAARRNAGTETGSRAALEAANCYNRENQTAAARGRYSTLKNDSHVGNEANAQLDELDKKAGPEIHAAKTPKPAPPPATATAAPPSATTKATKPADADPSINNSRR